MSFLSKLSEKKNKLTKFFFRKDKSYGIALLVGFFASIIFVSLYSSETFVSIESYFQALIYQHGYELPKNIGQITIIKKDQLSSALINKNPTRQEFASLFNFLGSTQKCDRVYKSRSHIYELLTVNFGFYKNIRNQRPINTSYEEWLSMIDNSAQKDKENIESYDQEKWDISSKLVTMWFKKPENKDKAGYTSFITANGQFWKPKGMNVFKILAGGNKYLLFPTFSIPWGSENTKSIVTSIVNDAESTDDSNPIDDLRKQELREILERWCNFFENLQYSEIVFEIKLFPEKKKSSNYEVDKTFISFSVKLKTTAHDTSYEVKPASVVGFDFVLQGEMDNNSDSDLAKALNNTQSKVILGALKKSEITNDGSANEEDSYIIDYSKSKTKIHKQNNTKSNDSSGNITDYLHTINQDEVFLKPTNIFLNNKEKVDYAMINMGAGSKSFVTEAPIIIVVDENVYEDGVLVATQTLKPSFALRIALEKLDFDRNENLNEQLVSLNNKIKNLSTSDANYGNKKEALEKEVASISAELSKPGYVETQIKVFKEIRESFINRKYYGDLVIKDLSIPINQNGFICIKFYGSTQKYKNEKAAIDSVSFYECFDDKLLREHLSKNPESKKLTPAFAHRRLLGNKDKGRNKGGKAYIAGPFEVTDFDFFPTPVDLSSIFQVCKEPLMGVELHANVVLNLINKDFLRHPSPLACLIGVVIVSFLTSIVLESLSPILGAIATLLILLGIYGYGYYSYNVLQQIFHISHLLFAVIFIWLVNTLLNYIKQRRKANSTKEMFSKFVSADVVQYMLDNPDLVRPGGSKTELTIFFSDVAGFTSISEALSPEDLVVLLNEYLGAMTDLLFEYGGTLDKFIGDAVMAFWNFPRTQEDHAVRAVLCAIAMQKKIAELQKDWAKRGLPKVAARCGINTAAVVVGYMGSQKAQMNFTCMGDGVNLASRLEGANKEYGTMMMVSDATYQKVKHVVRGRFLDFLAVKGKKEPVKVFELVCKHGEEPEGWFEKTELYDKAIQLHLERKWDEAIATFESVLKRWPDDGPSITYINRCNEYKDNPPPEGWDGRYILTHK